LFASSTQVGPLSLIVGGGGEGGAERASAPAVIAVRWKPASCLIDSFRIIANASDAPAEWSGLEEAA
jgi:hypothetical protein